MPTCSVCGAPLEGEGASCDYAVALEHAPGIGDPASIAGGRQTHADHELHIARWRIHHPTDRGATPAVMAWARDRITRAGHAPPPN